MKHYLLILLFTAFSGLLFGQSGDSITTKKPLKVEYNIINLSEDLNDTKVSIDITGGEPPYETEWSLQHIHKNSLTGKYITEGEDVQIKVTDSSGAISVIDIPIPTHSLPEIINGYFVPVVDVFSKIIFWDPFASLGIYDPILRDKDGNIMYHPNGKPVKEQIPIIVLWLVIGAIIFTVKMRFINFRGFKHAIDLVRGKYDNKEDKGEVNHFQALTTALSGTVGLGNIAGVAVAITLGGPGATFWMIVAGLLGMSSKFVECSLGVKYRKINADNRVSGGPMYYLRDGLKKKNLKWLGKLLAALFALLAIGGSLGGGNMFQANQAFSQLVVIMPGLSNMGPYFGAVLALLVGLVIIGGIKGIAKFTSRVVPFMAILYVVSALIIIFINITDIGEAIKLIVKGAFYPGALKGGVIGVLIIGFQRSAFSNEAGVGSAAIAHSAVKTDKPVTEGFVSLLEPFIDTVLICTMTALVIIFTGAYTNPLNLEGTELTSEAFGTVFSWYPYVLVITILLFAFSTMVSWSYYGLKAFDFLFGDIIKRLTGSRKISDNIYRIIFLFFIVVGSSSELGSVLDFSDMMILCMSFPNILGMFILAPEIKRDLTAYWKSIKTSQTK
ncbi:MAG: alanine/glycine:cation symporter family protein [Bacteroidales bacterium]